MPIPSEPGWYLWTPDESACRCFGLEPKPTPTLLHDGGGRRVFYAFPPRAPGNPGWVAFPERHNPGRGEWGERMGNAEIAHGLRLLAQEIRAQEKRDDE